MVGVMCLGTKTLYMAKKVVCDVCGDEIYLEPEDVETHRGGTTGKIGITEYEEGRPKHMCRDHLAF